MYIYFFKPGPLGILSYDLEFGIVTNLVPDSQAERKGVGIGWRMIKIDDRRYSKGLLKQKARGDEKYTITFITNVNPLFVSSVFISLKNKTHTMPAVFCFL